MKLSATNIVIAGVGGQGTLLLGQVLAHASSSAGLKAKATETLGLSQRGGSVASHVRIGEDVFQPLVWDGSADLLLGFEPLEALRAAKFLSTGSLVVLNTHKVLPSLVRAGQEKYPSIEEIVNILRRISRVVAIDATALADKAGNRISMNMVMLGAACATGRLPIPKEAAEQAMRNNVPKRAIDLNLKAFNLGYEETKKRIG